MPRQITELGRSSASWAHVARTVLGIGAAVVVLLLATSAAADVQACVTAAEKGQRARSVGKLREAHGHFVVCAAETCPALVRRDCSDWNSELTASIPTVVFGAHDNLGRDLFDVSVTMDGESIIQKLDGKAVMVDPGKHTFRFEAPGRAPVVEATLIKEGERARVISATFETTEPARPSLPAISADPSSISRRVRHTPYPWIVVGAGVVGAAVGAALVLSAPSRPSNCSKATQTCVPLPNESEANYRDDKARAGRADSQPVVGYVVGGAGLAVVAVGLVWHVLEPTGARHSAFRVVPWTNGLSSGITLGAAF